MSARRSRSRCAAEADGPPRRRTHVRHGAWPKVTPERCERASRASAVPRWTFFSAATRCCRSRSRDWRRGWCTLVYRATRRRATGWAAAHAARTSSASGNPDPGERSTENTASIRARRTKRPANGGTSARLKLARRWRSMSGSIEEAIASVVLSHRRSGPLLNQKNEAVGPRRRRPSLGTSNPQ
ncbi:hypothetical protein SAMN02927914_05859 [Mesorhizobium qingshengii]|uniref:Uncharacterized protein n=1 Tax=Mesorhizobium qingshengii TaxID=1165689 RepID=A0A1G5ZRE3_9HYPH|nr:hypothetical protein SAMN02927914_05859 [Mesorhizobium qingshengii]